MRLKPLARMVSPLLSRTVLPLLRRNGLPGTACLLYHEAVQDVFRSHVRYLDTHYDVISIEQLVEGLQAGDPPKDAVVLTVDDGYRSVYENIFPVAESEGVPVSVFISTDFVDSSELFWWDKADLVRERDPTFPPNSELKELPETERRTRIDDRFDELDLTHQKTTLSRSQVRELAESTHVTIHPHSKSHPRLTDQPDDAARAEIRDSRAFLREEFGCEANVFSFPDGAYSNRHISMVEQAGYDGALTIVPGLNTAETDPYRIRRISLCGVRESGQSTTTFDASSVPTMALAVHGAFRRLAGKRFET